jgi:hypothetical protein
MVPDLLQQKPQPQEFGPLSLYGTGTEERRSHSRWYGEDENEDGNLNGIAIERFIL